MMNCSDWNQYLFGKTCPQSLIYLYYVLLVITLFVSQYLDRNLIKNASEMKEKNRYCIISIWVINTAAFRMTIAFNKNLVSMLCIVVNVLSFD
jgi:hypothetical protein